LQGDVEQRKTMLVARALPTKWIEHPPQLVAVTDERVESFYEILAGATHRECPTTVTRMMAVTEEEIAALSKHWAEITSSTVLYRIDESRLATVLCPPLPSSLVEVSTLSLMELPCRVSSPPWTTTVTCSSTCATSSPPRPPPVADRIRSDSNLSTK